MSFLTASWDNLALINYEIDSEILKKHLPIGIEIDFWNSKCYVSLVGFQFNNTKILGLKIPFHINFEEVNLRFYVKRFENGAWKRGVVFIKEIVPKPAITFIANTLYNEHYQTNKMNHSITQNEGSKTFIYRWENDKQWNSIALETKSNPIQIELDSEAEFITEHYFGYTSYNKKTTFEYEVTHPRWEQLEIINYKIDVNFENNYGKDFAFLNESKPISVFLAKGSKITIENKRKIK